MFIFIDVELLPGNLEDNNKLATDSVPFSGDNKADTILFSTVKKLWKITFRSEEIKEFGKGHKRREAILKRVHFLDKR